AAVLWRRPVAAFAKPEPVQLSEPPRSVARSKPAMAAHARVPVAPTPPEPTLDDVRAQAHGGERELATDQARRITEAQPLNGEGHLLLGMLHLEDGALEPALNSLRRAVFLEPNNPLAHFSL